MVKAGHPWGRRKGARKGILSRLASAFKVTRPQAGERRAGRASPSTSSRRIHRRARALPAFSALLIFCAVFLVSGAFLSLLAVQALPVALVLAAIVGWVTWKSLKSRTGDS